MFDIPSMVTSVMGVITKFIPDATQHEAIQAAITQQIQTAIAAQSQAQTDIDKIEAGSENWFVSCWRPAIGWICAAGLLWHFIIFPSACAIALAIGSTVKFTDIDSPELMNLVLSMLGIGAMRTVERVMGVAATAGTKK